ncbi:MAG: hypothetical protein ACK56F_24650, partial [bacterium]
VEAAEPGRGGGRAVYDTVDDLCVDHGPEHLPRHGQQRGEQGLLVDLVDEPLVEGARVERLEPGGELGRLLRRLHVEDVREAHRRRHAGQGEAHERELERVGGGRG